MELSSAISPLPVITQSSSSSRSVLINKPTFISSAQSLNLTTCNKRHPKHGLKLKFPHFRTHTSGAIRCSTAGNPRIGESVKEEVQSKDNDVVFVAGATGKVGSRTVRELLKLGFQVRAGVRSAQRAETLVKSVQQMELAEGATAVEKLKIVECDLERDKIEQAIGNASVVICCIGASEKEVFDITGPCRIDYRATKNLIDAATVAGVKHFILVTSLGTNKFGFPAAILNLFWGVLIWKRKAEEALLASGLPYTIVRPGGMERPTDAYKQTHNIVLAEEDTLFGGQVSNLQVAELMAFMAKNRNLSYCKVVEVVAETTAPLTPMGDLLTKIPSQRADTSLQEDLQATPLLDAAPPQAKKSTVIEKEPILPVQTIEPNGRPLSPYIIYEDLKPPTSPTPTPSTSPSTAQAKVLDVVDTESSSSPSVTQTNLPEPTRTVVDEEPIQTEIQKTKPLSPYITYDDMKPPTSPTPTSPAGIKGQGDVAQADSTPTTLAAESSLSETPIGVGETESVQIEVQKTRLLSPYAAYDDLKPPTSPTPPQATSNDRTVVASPPKEAVPPAGDGDTMETTPTPGDAVQDDSMPTTLAAESGLSELSIGVGETESVQIEVQKTRLLSPYAAYDDLKPPTSPTPPQATSNDRTVVASPPKEAVPPAGDGDTMETTPTPGDVVQDDSMPTTLAAESGLSELSIGVRETESAQVEVQKTRLLSPYAAYDDLKPPTSPTPPQAAGNDRTVAASPPKEAVPPAGGGDLTETTPTQEIEKELSNGLAQKTSYLSPYAAYEDWKPPTSPCPSGRTSWSSSPSSISVLSEISTITNTSTVATPTPDKLEDKPEEKQHSSEPKPRPLSPFTMYEDLKPPSSPVKSLRNC